MRNLPHDCARIEKTAQGFPHFGIPVYHAIRFCWTCEADARSSFAHFMRYLPELRAWLEDGHDPSRECWDALYEHFFESMPYGTQTGDTGTVDEWLADRPEYVEELIWQVESYCIEEVPVRGAA